MPKVIGVKFRTSPRMYYFAPSEGESYEKGSQIVVETQRGVELATVIMSETDVPEDKIVAPLKPVLRKATDGDITGASVNDEERRAILATAKEKVAARNLDMKIVDCEYTVDHSKLVLYFTAEQRVDFRELVRDLASAFHMRIDLRQIGAREECKLIGSLGSCGLPCCCGRFESDSEHVSIKMAKNQGLALTPNKINGMCGRLLCCLSYENRTYEDVLRRSPKHGAPVTCPDGRAGTVVSVTPLTEKVRVRIGNDDNFEFCEYTLDELKCEPRGEQKQDGGNTNRQNGKNDNGGRDNNNNNRNNNRNKNKARNNNDQNKPAGNGNFDRNRDGSRQNNNNNNNNNNNPGNNQNQNGGNKNKNRNKHFKNKRKDRPTGGEGGGNDRGGGAPSAQ